MHDEKRLRLPTAIRVHEEAVATESWGAFFDAILASLETFEISEICVSQPGRVTDDV